MDDRPRQQWRDRTRLTDRLARKPEASTRGSRGLAEGAQQREGLRSLLCPAGGQHRGSRGLAEGAQQREALRGSFPSVRVGSEDALVGARGADRPSPLDVAQRHWRAPVGEHARDLVTGRFGGRGLHGRDAPERAATQRLTADDGQLVRRSAEWTRHERHSRERTDRVAVGQLASSTSQNRAGAHRAGQSRHGRGH